MSRNEEESHWSRISFRVNWIQFYHKQPRVRVEKQMLFYHKYIFALTLKFRVGISLFFVTYFKSILQLLMNNVDLSLRLNFCTEI